jgi:hypothetical protein
VGDLVGRTFSVWKASFGPFALLALLTQVLLFALGWASGSPYLPFRDKAFAGPSAQMMAWTFSGPYWAYLAGTLLVFSLFVGALTVGALRALAGEPVRAGEMLSTMLRRAPALLLGGTLSGLAFYLGLLLLVVPGVIWALMFSLAGPAIVAERLGGWSGLKRSAALTRGARWKLLGAFLVCAVAGFSPAYVGLGLSVASPLAGGIVSLVANVVLGPVPLIAPAIAYHALRVSKEGAGTAELARVFD